MASTPDLHVTFVARRVSTPPVPAFFEPGRTYTHRDDKGRTTRFHVDYVGTPPPNYAGVRGTGPVAAGWYSRTDTLGVVTPLGFFECTDLAGWIPDPPDTTTAEPVLAYQAQYCTMPLGNYTSEQAARDHCEDYARLEAPDGADVGLLWEAEDEGEPLELCTVINGLQVGTGYVVMVLELLAAYDPDAER